MAKSTSNHMGNRRNQRLRVLIADDSPVTRRSTKLMMRLIPDIEVVAMAQNGREAVDLARVHQPDIALMDVKMPEMNGLEAVQAMLKINPNLACIMLSAERDRDTLKQAVTAGARSYLIKPFTSEQLVETVTRIIKQLKVNQPKQKTAAPAAPNREAYLMELAAAYIKARRTDDQAIEVFESLAADLDCDIRWLRHLAIIYVLRGQWGKLRSLAERLERQTQPAGLQAHV